MSRNALFSFPGSLAITFLLMFECGPTLAASLSTTQPSDTIDLNVFAASSLTNALQQIGQLYEQSRPDVDVNFTFGASGTLLQQIQQGASPDVFFPASTTDLDNLQSTVGIVPGTRQDVVSNRLAIITPVNSTLSVSSVQDLLNPQVTRVAIGQPSVVPAGQYAQQLFNSSGVSSQIQPKLTFGQNVRDVLNLVASGQADAGVVYVTDALQSGQVRVADIPPTNAYSPIIYPAAVLRTSANPAVATDFTNFLSSEPALGVFEQFGFTPAPTGVPEPSSVYGTLALGVLGLGWGLKRKKHQKQKSLALLQKSVKPDFSSVGRLPLNETDLIVSQTGDRVER